MKTYSILTVTIVLVTAGVARAQAAPAAAVSVDPSLAPTSSAAPPRDSGTHDSERGDPRFRPLHGLYVRGGLGFGGFGNNVIAGDKGNDNDQSEGTVTGMGMTSEITLGGAVSDNWVLGGGAFSSYVFTTNYTQINGESIPAGLKRPQTATLIGFLADWRFAPELGLHAQAALGAAGLSSQRYRNGELDGSSTAFGPGVSFGVGAEFWLDPHWALGAIARFTAAAVMEKQGGQDYVHGVVSPSLLMTVAYNE